MRQEYTATARTIYKQIDRTSGGVFTVLWGSFQSFAETRAPESAASLAYYALFSMFPLLVFFVGTATSYLEDEAVKQFIFELVETNLPASFQDLIKGNIDQALSARGRVQIVGIIGLLWAASGVFTGLTHSLDRAWHTARERNFIFGRLIGLGMIGAITTGLVVIWFLSTTLLNLLPLLEVRLWNGESVQVYDTYLWGASSKFIPWLVIFFAFVNLYKWVPNTKVRWREALWGAAVAALGWELAQRGFSWYLTSGWARYQLVYGSLGAVIAFMLWLYVNGLIVLYGAHLSASIAMETRLKYEKDVGV